MSQVNETIFAILNSTQIRRLHNQTKHTKFSIERIHRSAVSVRRANECCWTEWALLQCSHFWKWAVKHATVKMPRAVMRFLLLALVYSLIWSLLEHYLWALPVLGGFRSFSNRSKWWWSSYCITWITSYYLTACFALLLASFLFKIKRMDERMVGWFPEL